MALDIYSMLGGMGPPAPSGPTRADAMTQIQAVRDQHIPQEYAQMEAADAGAAQAYSAGSQAADLFLASTLGVPERVERGFTDAATTVADTADQLGKGVRSRDEMMAGDIYQSLARAGQDTGVATALQDIAGRSQGVINAMGGFTVENLLKNASAAGLYANQVRNQGAASFRNAGKMPTGGAARATVNSGYEAAVGDTMRGLGEQSAKAAEQAAGDDWEKRKFIVETAIDMMNSGNKSKMDWAKIAAQASQFEDRQTQTQSQFDTRQAASAADDARRAAEQAADDRRRAAQDRQKNRQQAVGNRDDALKSVRAQAVKLAKEMAALTRKAQQTRKNPETGLKESYTATVPNAPAYTIALKRLMAELTATYAVDLTRAGIKRQRVAQIARDALAAAGFQRPPALGG